VKELYLRGVEEMGKLITIRVSRNLSMMPWWQGQVSIQRDSQLRKPKMRIKVSSGFL